jgi:hypothetical protein
VNMTSRWRRLGATLGLGLALSFAAPAEATVAVQLSRAELVAQSDLVVRATVVDVTSRWNEDHSQIISLTTLRVSEALKGTGVEALLVLRQLGGEVDGLVSRIAGNPVFAPGQEAVFFVRRGPGVVYLTGLAQAVFYVQPPVAGTPVVQRDLTGLTFARLSSGAPMRLVEPTPEAPETLQHLRADVQALAGGGL